MLEQSMKRICGLSGVILILAVLFIVAFPVRSANAATYTTINVTASDISSAGIDDAVQDALDEAAENATSSNPYKVVVADGSYKLTACLYVCSNTYLDLSGVTLTKATSDARNMIKIGDSQDTQKGYYYTNITIYGGTFDANKNSNTVIKLAHAKNVTVSKTTFKNVSNAHLMEVAGINTLTISSCTFQNQTMSTSLSESNQTPEAIQLDILTSKHFSGYLYEDLALKNVTITGCTFSNVPRGVGSHTTVLNNPIDGLTIKWCTFKSIGSAAVQLMGVVNCTISSNTISGAPRGIAVYSYREGAKGVYSSAAIEDASAGGSSTASTTSTKYKTPTSANIVIKSNTITLSGTDKYGDYESCGIYLYGLNLSSKKSSTECGTIPAGNYYLKGVTVSSNTIKVSSGSKAHGIRVSDARSVKVTSNKLTGTTSGTYYGISALNASKSIRIESNTVKKFYRGVYVYGSSTSPSVSKNTISSSRNNGITVQTATVTKVSSNTVSSVKNYGIFLYKKSKVSTISSNTVKSCKKEALRVTDTIKCALTVSKNTFSKCGSSQVVYVSPGSKTYKITLKSNTIVGVSKKTVGIKIDTGKVVVKSNTIRSCSYPVGKASKASVSFSGNTYKSNKYNKVKG